MFNFLFATSDSQRLLSKMDLKLFWSYGTTCIFYKRVIAKHGLGFLPTNRKLVCGW